MSSINIKNIFEKLVYYFSHKPELITSLYLIFGLLCIVFILSILVIVFNKSVFIKQINIKKDLARYIGLVFGNFFLIFFTVYFSYFSNLIFLKHLQPIIIIIIIITNALIITRIYKMYKRVKTNDYTYIGVFVGPLSKDSNIRIIRNYYRKLKYLYLICFLPFLLLFIGFTNKHLYTFVFDNSVSMATQNSNASTSLKNVVADIKENSHFIISTIPNKTFVFEDFKFNLNEIIKTKDKNDLCANTYLKTDKQSFISYLSNDLLSDLASASPIYECIWSSFINSVEASKSNSYSKKTLIILTDGEDNLYFDLDYFQAPNNCVFDYDYEGIFLNVFFDNIYLISYENLYKYMFKTCGNYTVLDGSNENNLSVLFSDIFKNNHFDIEFIVILLSFIIFGFLIIIYIK
jgi:hypothetical protein